MRDDHPHYEEFDALGTRYQIRIGGEDVATVAKLKMLMQHIVQVKGADLFRLTEEQRRCCGG